MAQYDLTLAKEVTRECAWGILGTINRIENKMGSSLFLELIEKKIEKEIREIPGMNFDEINTLDIKCAFVRDVLSELEKV
ncbi:hypothetical protein FSBG_01584 [Fusobacterium gonidiaformans 3-1-5R]|uniref:Uncharacterized protein n=1 Tax=Fusobacterium gonidiaformans 3-1-5R TaxID=469605 RepID=E5BHW4_9FUSO|nr:hypothetical protein [Fusobacterium gonidiaformans]EFS22087.1 hypothetical protein FSBG_01584 [Fusobacterium gonidiaformans 3-1-5R]